MGKWGSADDYDQAENDLPDAVEAGAGVWRSCCCSPDGESCTRVSRGGAAVVDPGRIPPRTIVESRAYRSLDKDAAVLPAGSGSAAFTLLRS